MNTNSRNKTLIIIIGILLAANIALISMLLMNKGNHPGGRIDKKTMISNYLKKEVGFTPEQQQQYEKISQGHKDEMRGRFDDMNIQREKIFRQLAASDFSDSAIRVAATAMASQQQGFEEAMLHHLKEIRRICTPQQLSAFDSGFYKIISKRGERKTP